MDGLTGEAANKKYGDIQFTNAQATIELKGGESVVATGLPLNASYTVIETDNPNFVGVSGIHSGNITESRISEANFTNMRKTGDLEVSKAVVSDAAADADQVFTFTVKVNGLTGEAADKKYGDMQFTDGEATVELKGGQSVKATGLPTGVTYTVTEAVDANFETESEGTSGTIAEGTQSAKFTNTRKTGDLKVSKKVVGTEAEKAQNFSFTVTLDDDSISGKYGDMTFTAGVATFTLTGGETKVAKGLPTTVGYKVVEQTPSGCEVTMTGDTGTIVEATDTRGPASALFINTFASGSKAIYGYKVFRNGDLDKKQFTFALYDEDDELLQKAKTDSDGFFEFKPLEYTLNDLANDDGTYDTSRVFKYYVTEVVPSDVDSKGLDKKSMIKYDLSEKPVTVVVTNKGNGVLEASVSGDLNIKFTNIQQDKGKVKTGDTGFGGSLLIFLLASTALIAAISYRRRRQEL